PEHERDEVVPAVGGPWFPERWKPHPRQAARGVELVDGGAAGKFKEPGQQVAVHVPDRRQRVFAAGAVDPFFVGADNFLRAAGGAMETAVHSPSSCAATANSAFTSRHSQPNRSLTSIWNGVRGSIPWASG